MPQPATNLEEVWCTPRTPTGPPSVLRDQVMEQHRKILSAAAADSEHRLQSFIAQVMEQQYERLSGRMLESLQRSLHTTSLRSSGRPSASTSPGGLTRPEDITSAVMADTVTLLKPHESNGNAEQTKANNSQNPPKIASPKSTKLVAGSMRESEKTRNSKQPPKSDPVESQEAEVDFAATSISLGHVDTYSSKCGWDSSRASATGISDWVRPSRRHRISCSVMNDDTVLEDLLNAERKKNKNAQARMKSKFKKNQEEKRDSLTGEVIRNSAIARILENAVFDSCCAVVIVLNSILIGFSVEWLTTHEEESVAHLTLGHLCNIFFIGELTLRLFVYRLSYFTSEDWKWNLFDFSSLVLFAVIDFVVLATVGNNGAGSVGSILKILKMLRIVRIFRVFRFFKELSLLALMIMDSLKSLVWALLMLIIIIYVFAICFTQNAIDFQRTLEEDGSSDMDAEVKRQFGSLPRTIYSLVNAMLGGVSWGIVSDALLHMDAFSAVLFFFYISFSILAVLNIITGVFVDNAVETAKTEREFLIQKETELREKLMAEMRELFAEMDEDESGSVSFEELQRYFDDQRVRRYFQALGLDPGDAERLFRLIDTDGSGEVHVDEFLDGCLRLKGEARSIDVNAILWQCRQLQGRLDRLETDVDSRLDSITKCLEQFVKGGDKAKGQEFESRARSG